MLCSQLFSVKNEIRLGWADDCVHDFCDYLNRLGSDRIPELVRTMKKDRDVCRGDEL